MHSFLDLRSPSLDIICIHINELSHMGRLDNGVTHNAVNFYHCFKMWASQEKTYLAGLHYIKFGQAIYYKPFPLRGFSLTSTIGQFWKERISKEGE